MIILTGRCVGKELDLSQRGKFVRQSKSVMASWHLEVTA